MRRAAEATPSSTRKLMVPEAGLEPARPIRALPPQDSVSTSSTTPACCQIDYWLEPSGGGVSGGGSVAAGV